MTHSPRLTIRRAALVLLALSAAPLALAGCGNNVPPNAVARVGGETIEKEEFNHWLEAAAKAQQQPGAPAAQTVVPDPPNFEKCVAARGKQPVPKGAKKPSPEELKSQCKQEYDSLKDQVMQFLISAEWIQQEAKDQDVEASDEEVQKQFQEQKKQSFPKEKDYQEFLKRSGQTEEDLLFRVKLDVLSNELRKKIVKDKGKITEASVAAYYEKNKSRFAQPERRDLRVVLTKKEGQAQEAKQALEGGQSFKQVAKRYSVDEASKAQGGKLPGVAKGQQEKAFDKAIFAARKGELTGPVKTQFGYYVFEVTKVTKASQQTLGQSRETIKGILRSQQEQKALDAFIKTFRKDYKEKTNCAKGYVIPDCKNAPPQKRQQQPPGQPPQGQQPQQPPQGGQPQQPPPQQPQGGGGKEK
jgi:foldase protein PrsA